MKIAPVLPRFISSPALLMQGLLLTLILTLVLVITSIFLFSINVFQPMNLSEFSADILYSISLSGSNPYAGLTLLVMLAVGLRLLSQEKRFSFVLSIGMSLVLLLSLNALLKPYFQHERPHIVWLEQQGLLDSQSFYRLDKGQRRMLVQDSLQQLALRQPELDQPEIVVPQAVQRHWQQQVSYSFPSGHMLFATSLFIVLGFYLLSAGQTVLTMLLFCWLLAMAASRLLLGVHWPQDILASILIGSGIGGISLGITHACHRSLHKCFIQWRNRFIMRP